MPIMSGTEIDLLGEPLLEVGWVCPGEVGWTCPGAVGLVCPGEDGWTCPGLDNTEDADASGRAEAEDEVDDGEDGVPLQAVRVTAKTTTQARRHWFLSCALSSALSDADSRETPPHNSPTIPIG
jgi:hypothetical protein